jgi:hypothetical protein
MPRKPSKTKPGPKVLWRKFRNYSGPLIKGTEPYTIPDDRRDFHVDRAFWLTAKVETGAKFGSVMAYDGTGMTAGLDQHIAVFPRELAHEDNNPKDDQGSLWKLLRRMESVGGSPSYQACLKKLWDALARQDWYVAQDGYLRHLGRNALVRIKPGSLVHGQLIRDVLTPLGGNVERHGGKDRAADWAKLFHAVFSHPDGFRAQAEFGKEHLVERAKKRHIKWAYKEREITALQPLKNMPAEQDLAMCMYHCHSVNAPAIANKALKRARYADHGDVRPKKLIQLLGNSSFGRWDDDLKNGRYQRTRSAARASGLWPRSLFDGPNAIMPKDLPG